MPAKTTIFDHRVNVLHDFGMSPRNYISYNPQGRLIMLAGFGNLNGAVDIWDRKTLKKEASYNAPNTSHTEWSPDGRYIICATLSPRMRVDNGVRILHWSGSLIHQELVSDLYQVSLSACSACCRVLTSIPRLPGDQLLQIISLSVHHYRLVQRVHYPDPKRLSKLLVGLPFATDPLFLF